MSALAEWQAVDRSTMTAQVKRLERAGLARRHTDPTDRRASIVALTREGKAVCDEIRREASAFFVDLLAGWTPRQRRELIESMTRLSTALEKHLEPA
jgi:regulatory protein, marR